MIQQVLEQETECVLDLTSPQSIDKDVRTAHERSLDCREPVFVPAQLFADDRGWSLMNQLQGVLQPAGQINFSVQYPGVVKAWHRHALQTDFWMCVQGNMKAGVFRQSDGQAWQVVFGEKRPGVLIIPPTLWHGAATIGPNSAGLLYYVSQAYNAANPDEERRPAASVIDFPWAVQHR